MRSEGIEGEWSEEGHIEVERIYVLESAGQIRGHFVCFRDEVAHSHDL